MNKHKVMFILQIFDICTDRLYDTINKMNIHGKVKLCSVEEIWFSAESLFDPSLFVEYLNPVW